MLLVQRLREQPERRRRDVVLLGPDLFSDLLALLLQLVVGEDRVQHTVSEDL